MRSNYNPEDYDTLVGTLTWMNATARDLNCRIAAAGHRRESLLNEATRDLLSKTEAKKSFFKSSPTQLKQPKKIKSRDDSFLPSQRGISKMLEDLCDTERKCYGAYRGTVDAYDIVRKREQAKALEGVFH